MRGSDMGITDAMDAMGSIDRLSVGESVLAVPMHSSSVDYLACTTERECLEWFRVKSKAASRKRLMSGRSERSITPLEVWQVSEDAQGWCAYCGLLAVEVVHLVTTGGQCRGWGLADAEGLSITGCGSLTGIECLGEFGLGMLVVQCLGNQAEAGGD
jgi:hypothetical protein